MADNQEPTYRFCAQYEKTEGPYAAAMADAYGMPPHPWQRGILDDWLALDEHGRLLNWLCVLAVPRQNGKTGVSDPRETWGLVKRGEWILHTAHEFQTAQKAFDRLRRKFGMRKNDPDAEFPELNRLVKKYTTSANQMVLDLTNGGHIEFRTRGSGGDMGRGGTFDLVVIDEAQNYTKAQDAALSPLNSAAPHGSPQTILMGTVPDPSGGAKGAKFASIRGELASAPYAGGCIHEWAAPEVGDVADRSRWPLYNPSLGLNLLHAGLEKDLHSMDAETFAREHLGWWPAVAAASSPITREAWDACKIGVEEVPRDGVVCYAVKFAPDGATGSLAVCCKPDEGRPYIQCVANRNMGGGVGWFERWLVPREGEAAEIVIDGKAHAAALIGKLSDAGFADAQIRTPASGDVASACSMLVNAVNAGEVAHAGQEALDDSATKTNKRRIGANGGFGFESTDDADATIVEACALALWSASTTTRDQRRVARVG